MIVLISLNTRELAHYIQEKRGREEEIIVKEIGEHRDKRSPKGVQMEFHVETAFLEKNKKKSAFLLSSPSHLKNLIDFLKKFFSLGGYAYLH